MLRRGLSAIGFGCTGLFLFGLELSELISPEQARIVTLVSGVVALISFSLLGTHWLLRKVPPSSPLVRVEEQEELTALQYNRLMNALLNLSPEHHGHLPEVIEDIISDLLTHQSLIRDCRVCGMQRFEEDFCE